MNYIKYLTLIFLITILSSCNLGYEKTENNVYYKYWNEGSGNNKFEVIGANPMTFKILANKEYATDKNQAYYKGIAIPFSDSKTFIALEGFYSKDKNHAYRESKIINGADSENFKIIDGWSYTKDLKDYYYDTIPLKVNDISSFKILEGNYGNWAKDRTHYYIFSKKYPLADYNSFEVIGEGYAKDNKKVYFKNSVVAGADPKTFEPTEYAYGKDANYRFDGSKKLNIKDVNSYQIINSSYTKDKLNVYVDGKIIKEADSKTFEFVSWQWQKDKNNYFYQGVLFEIIDYDSFVILKANYAKDKNRVYFYNQEIIGAAPSSFTVDIMTHIGTDNINCYKGTKKIKCN